MVTLIFHMSWLCPLHSKPWHLRICVWRENGVFNLSVPPIPTCPRAAGTNRWRLWNVVLACPYCRQSLPLEAGQCLICSHLRRSAFPSTSLVFVGSFQEDKGEPSVKFFHVTSGGDGETTPPDDFDWPRWVSSARDAHIELLQFFDQCFGYWI